MVYVERGLHPCPVPGCPELTRRGHCPTHAQARKAPYRGDWAPFSARYLREHPRCVRCGARATQTDHVVSLALGGAHLDPANARALCARCHGQRTAHDSRPRMSRRRSP